MHSEHLHGDCGCGPKGLHMHCKAKHVIYRTNAFAIGDFVYYNTSSGDYRKAIEGKCDFMVVNVDNCGTWFEVAFYGEFQTRNYDLMGELFIDDTGTLTTTPTTTKVGFIENGNLYLFIDRTKVTTPQTNAEGNNVLVTAAFSHGEGQTNTIELSADHSHVEGFYNTIKAGAIQSHVEGYENTNYGKTSHVEGIYNICNKDYSHVEGNSNTCNSDNSHVEGRGHISSAEFQHIQGKYSTDDTAYVGTNPKVHKIGWGVDSNTRKDISFIRADGTIGTAAFKTDGTGTPTGLGATCPAVTPTVPYAWLQFELSDGSIVYMPAWK